MSFIWISLVFRMPCLPDKCLSGKKPHSFNVGIYCFFYFFVSVRYVSRCFCHSRVYSRDALIIEDLRCLLFCISALRILLLCCCRSLEQSWCCSSFFFPPIREMDEGIRFLPIEDDALYCPLLLYNTLLLTCLVGPSLDTPCLFVRCMNLSLVFPVVISSISFCCRRRRGYRSHAYSDVFASSLLLLIHTPLHPHLLFLFLLVLRLNASHMIRE